MRSLVASRLLQVAASVALAALAGWGQRSTAQAEPARAEARTALIYQVTLHRGAPALRAFLMDFPKGADLHVHLSGAVYAETLIHDAAEDGLCVDTVALSLANPPCTGNLVPATGLQGNISRQSQLLYDKLIDSLSVRSFVPSAGWSRHDQFFAVFDRTNGLSNRHKAEWVDEVASRAATENNQYLELMDTPSFSRAAEMAHDVGWNASLSEADPQAFAQFRQQLLDRGLRDEVEAARKEGRQAEAGRKQIEHCGTPIAAPACQVEVRFLDQVLRDLPPENVFAQLLLGFETSGQHEREGQHLGGRKHGAPRRRFCLHARLHAAHENGRLPPFHVSRRAHLAARRRARLRSCAAGGIALSYSPGS